MSFHEKPDTVQKMRDFVSLAQKFPTGILLVMDNREANNYKYYHISDPVKAEGIDSEIEGYTITFGRIEHSENVFHCASTKASLEIKKKALTKIKKGYRLIQGSLD